MDYFFNYEYFQLNESEGTNGLKVSLNNNIGAKVNNTNGVQLPNGTAGTAGTADVVTSGTAGTAGEVENVDEAQLNAKIQEWNGLYSQAFKFQNNMPSDVNSKVDLTNIGQKNPNNDPEITTNNNNLLAKVKEAIIKMSELLTSKSGENFMFKGRSINVVGHTSEPGKPEYNMTLSKRRSDFVINAIKSAMVSILTSQKATIKPDEIVTFVSVPKGETELIITNDVASGDAILNTNNKEIEGGVDVKVYQTPEQKQGLNRRVTIGLDKFPIIYKKPTTPKQVDVIKAQEEIPTINPTDVKFNTDSYIITSSSESILSEFANKVIEAVKNGGIKDIYICSHSHKGKENDADDIVRQENKIFHISLNRAVVVKNFLEGKGIKVNYHVIPCSFLIPKGSADENKRVEIYFEDNDNVKQAKGAFNKLSKQFGVENSNGEYNGNRILPNKILREDIIGNIKGCIQDGAREKWIPLELWYDEYGTKEDNLKGFKKQIEDTISKYGKGKYKGEEFVYNKK